MSKENQTDKSESTLKKFYVPSLDVVVEAKDFEDAAKKAEQLKASKRKEEK